MRCFQHHDLEAVAVCPGCGKALCSACAKQGQFGRQLCSDACGSRLDRLDRQDDRTDLVWPLLCGVLFFTGALFFGIALMEWWGGGARADRIAIMVILGAGGLSGGYWVKRSGGRSSS